MTKTIHFFRATALATTALLSAACFGKPQEKNGAVTHVSAGQAAELLRAGGVTVIDVRTPGEFAEGRIAGAVNIDFQSRDFASRLAGLDPAKPYLVHCRSGSRSGRALGAFKKQGFAKIYHLDGGVIAWSKAGQPLRR
jgi:rhodanese-related sulfurtransferase